MTENGKACKCKTRRWELPPIAACPQHGTRDPINRWPYPKKRCPSSLGVQPPSLDVSCIAHAIGNTLAREAVPIAACPQHGTRDPRAWPLASLADGDCLRLQHAHERGRGTRSIGGCTPGNVIELLLGYSHPRAWPLASLRWGPPPIAACPRKGTRDPINRWLYPKKRCPSSLGVQPPSRLASCIAHAAGNTLAREAVPIAVLSFTSLARPRLPCLGRQSPLTRPRPRRSR